MYPFAHFFITYYLLNIFILDIKQYILQIILFSIILDIDHIPSYFKLFIKKIKNSKTQIWDQSKLSRTIIQEPIVIILIEFIFIILYLFGIKTIILLIAALSMLIHWVIDFIMVYTRPFAPFDNRKFSLFFYTKRQRVISEIIITLIFMILFLLVYFS